jgi:DNA-binding transcriptional ArsR family regulator
MSRPRHPSSAAQATARQQQARLFAALGDPTRLELLHRLSLGQTRSIVELSSDARITRQAISKHLRVLQDADLVAAERAGREVRFRFRPETVTAASDYLADVARLWEEALGRLKSFIEEPPDNEPPDELPTALR